MESIVPEKASEKDLSGQQEETRQMSPRDESDSSTMSSQRTLEW